MHPSDYEYLNKAQLTQDPFVGRANTSTVKKFSDHIEPSLGMQTGGLPESISITISEAS